MMKKLWLLLLLPAAGCVYSDTPYGRYAHIDLPVQHSTVVHKTVTVNAPPGTTVVYTDAQPVSAYGNQGYVAPDCRVSRLRNCRYYGPPRPAYPRPVYRSDGANGGIAYEYYER